MAELGQCADFDLADPLLADAHLLPDLLQRSGLDLAVETETPRDDVAFARVEMAEDSADIGLALGLGAFLFEGVGARVGRGAEKLFVPGAESVS